MAERVAVIADWDADGVVAASIVVYAQERLGLFPARGKTRVFAHPAGPRSIGGVLGGACWEYLVILDIPFTESVERAIARYLDECPRARVYYVDHHDATLERIIAVKGSYPINPILGSEPSSRLIYDYLYSLGARFTPRITSFVEAVEVIEGSRQPDPSRQGLLDMVVSISKALNQTKSVEMWVKYVRWISNPLPFEEAIVRIGGHEKRLVEAAMEISRRSDERLREVAMSLAMEAKSVGSVKFVDAKGRWRERGTSALASMLYKILKATVALLVDKEDGAGQLLIIRSSRGEAMRILDELAALGILADKGGHENLAIARLRPGVTRDQVEEALRVASIRLAQRHIQG